VVDTESLVTVLVVVPKQQLREWTAQYETLEADDLAPLMAESGPLGARAVVPRSSTQIAEDSDSVLVSIVVLRRFVDQIKVTTSISIIHSSTGALTNRTFIPRPSCARKSLCRANLALKRAITRRRAWRS
jgi:hypothetical protein